MLTPKHHATATNDRITMLHTHGVTVHNFYEILTDLQVVTKREEKGATLLFLVRQYVEQWPRNNSEPL